MKTVKLSFLIFSFLFCTNAYAYLDPGSISLFIQGLIAGLIGFIYGFRAWANKIKKFLVDLFKRK